jgi:hypothetical protein
LDGLTDRQAGRAKDKVIYWVESRVENKESLDDSVSASNLSNSGIIFVRNPGAYPSGVP